jgi:hypothetical protein
MALPLPRPAAIEIATVMTSALLTEGLHVLVDGAELPRIDYAGPGATWLDTAEVADGALLWYLALERGGVMQVYLDGERSYYVQDPGDIMGWYGVWLPVERVDGVSRVIAPDGRVLAITVPATIGEYA